MKCNLTPNAIHVLEERYLRKDSNNKIIETPEQMFRRIADYISDSPELANKIFQLMCETKFLPNSPAFNAGTDINNFSACFAIGIDDSMESIFQTLKTSALIFQSGGGVGFDFSSLRPKGAPVKSTQGVASGVVSFATVYNSAIEIVKQGGIRRGAAIGLLSISHPEVMDWIHAKDEGSTLSNFNLSVIITNEFMEAVKNNKDWNLEFKGKIYKTLPARQIFDEICKQVHKSGDPGIVFIDNVNRYNYHKHIGLIHNTNPCGEISIFTGVSPFDYPELNIKKGDAIAESCNLGSFDISKYVESGNMNWNELANDIKHAIAFLDCIPDKNKYIIPEIEKGTKLLRKVGLGLMGFSDTLALLNISYNSKEAIEFAEYLMEFINYHSTKASTELAKSKGKFLAFEGSAWDTEDVWSFKNTTDKFDWNSLKSDIKKYGIRNCNVNAIAPTGTLSIIAGCSSGIEPIFNVVYEKHISLGVLYEVNPYFVKLMKERGLWNDVVEKKCSKQASIQNIQEIPDDIKRLFLTSHDVPYKQHIEMQRAFQKFTDINISKTINMCNNATVSDISEAYMMASDGCKGITIYRDGSKNEQVLKVSLKDAPTPRQRFKDHLAVVREIHTACGVFYNTITVDEYGIFEDFQINSKKGGCDASGKAMGRATSMLLRHNVPVQTIIKQYHRVDCNACIIKKTKVKKDLDNGIEVSPEEMITIMSCADGISNHLSDYNNNKEILEKMLLLQKTIHKQFNSSDNTIDNLSEDAKLVNKGRVCLECGSSNVDDSKCGTCKDCGFSKCL